MIRGCGWLMLLFVCLVALAGCSDDDSAETATAPAGPTGSRESGLTLALDPATPQAGATIELRVDGPMGVEASYGPDALLERRDGGEWVGSHTLIAAEVGGEPVPIGRQVAVPAIGYTGGDALGYALPDVAPGRYRISREVGVSGVPGVLAETLTVEFEITS